MPHILYDGFVDDEFSGVPPVIVVVDLGHLEFLRRSLWSMLCGKQMKISQE
jgi:hypothetical protein